MTSVDPDGAVVMWDEPRCSSQSTDAAGAADCLNKELISYYQVAYRMIGMKEEKPTLTLDSSEEADEGDNLETEGNYLE